MPTDQPSGEVPATAEVSGSQGVVVGTGNVQINNNLPPKPPKPTLNPAMLAALSPHAAVTRIRQLSHDDAVDLFASATPEVLTDKLKALLLRDEARAVAILADLDPDKAAELISPHEDGFSWLPALPAAAEAIVEHAVDLKWDHDPGAGSLERAAQSPEGTNGYFRQYKQGRIYWSDDENDTYAVSGPIAELHLASGGTGGEFGFPVSDEESDELESGTLVMAQAFEGCAIFSSTHGTYSVSLASSEVWDDWLGSPVAVAETHSGVELQRFEDGLIYSSKAGTFAVRSEVGKRAKHWVPISAEEDVPSHPTARVQHFRGAGGGEIAVYSSEATGVQWVSGRTLALYKELGGLGSWLGFPTAAQVDIRPGRVQSFEHGSIYLGPGSDAVAVAVPVETVELVGDRLGWPVSQEKSIDGSGDETIQYFEKGAVILRDGKGEIWMRQPPG